MKSTTPDQLSALLAELGVPRGANLLVHSDVAAFGLFEGGMAALFDVLREAIGPEGTIATPAYRFSAPPEEPYDRRLSPSIGVGAFSEHVRKAEGSRRTGNPIHSHALNGPLAEAAAERRQAPSFGPGADFEFFLAQSFQGLFLGCGFEKAGTLIIHAQALASNVPYRSWQTSRRVEIVTAPDGSTSETQFEAPYYARDKGAPRETRVGIERALREAGLLTEGRLAYGPAMYFDAGQVVAESREIFERDPMASTKA